MQRKRKIIHWFPAQKEAIEIIAKANGRDAKNHIELLVRDNINDNLNILPEKLKKEISKL